MTPLELLYERAGLPELDLPPELARLYGGPFGIVAPRLVANFVETIDGVVAMPELPRSNALIADDSEADRLVMGLLRACASAVVVGSGTILGSPQGTWRPERVFPPAAASFAELRRTLGLGERPTVAVVTAGASFDPTHPILEESAIVLTTAAAAPDIRASVPAACEVVAVNEGDRVALRSAVAALRERGHALVLSEGGPTLFGGLLAEGLVDELFLTISPLLAGRGARPRLSLVEGVELLPGSSRTELLSARRHGGHLLLRYGVL